MDAPETKKTNRINRADEDPTGGWWGPIKETRTSGIARCQRPYLEDLEDCGLPRRERELIQESYFRRSSLYNLLGDLGIESAPPYSRLELVNAYGWDRDKIYHAFRLHLLHLLKGKRKSTRNAKELQDAIRRIDELDRYQIGGTSRHYTLSEVLVDGRCFCPAAAHHSLRRAVRRNRELMRNPDLEVEMDLRFNAMCYCHQATKSRHEHRDFFLPAIGMLRVLRNFEIKKLPESSHLSRVTGHYVTYQPAHVILASQTSIAKEVCKLVRTEVDKAVKRDTQKFDEGLRQDAHEAIDAWEKVLLHAISVRKRLRKIRKPSKDKGMRKTKGDITDEHGRASQKRDAGKSRARLKRARKKILASGRAKKWWQDEIIAAQENLPENDYESLRDWVEEANWFMENYGYRLQTEDNIDCLLKANKDKRSASGCYLQLTGKDKDDRHRTRGFSQSKVTWVTVEPTPTATLEPSLTA